MIWVERCRAVAARWPGLVTGVGEMVTARGRAEVGGGSRSAGSVPPLNVGALSLHREMTTTWGSLIAVVEMVGGSRAPLAVEAQAAWVDSWCDDPGLLEHLVALVPWMEYDADRAARLLGIHGSGTLDVARGALRDAAADARTVPRSTLAEVTGVSERTITRAMQARGRAPVYAEGSGQAMYELKPGDVEALEGLTGRVAGHRDFK